MRQLREWTVEYLDGSSRPPQSVNVPHAWHQEVDLRWDGPAIYRTRFRAEAGEEALLFEGISYAAEVWINGELCQSHRGIWDAFIVPLPEPPDGHYQVEVHVTKNGGRYPVKEVMSGFLPYVFGTFGGMFRPVYLGELNEMQLARKPNCQTEIRSQHIFWRGERFRAKGVLTWGWYPELGHPHPDEATILTEILQAKELGFNLIKFCLWLPPHRYLELMDAHNLAAWIELPLWLVEGTEEQLEDLRSEALLIAAQYAHHPNIVFWTAGCELSHSTPAPWRQRIVEDLMRVTGSPLVKDNSGGAEMYGGDPREYGSFDDFHPYCDTHFYPQVLDSLRSGVRRQGPILLGEFNDIDLYRPLRDLQAKPPYWASPDPARNARGVRWQYDLPNALAKREELEPSDACIDMRVRLSESKASFLRQYVMDSVSQIPEIQGYVITGWRDTPISTSGFVDDAGALKVAMHPAQYTDAVRFSLVPRRRPPWVEGGNRAGWVDRYVIFADQPQLWLLAVDSEVNTQSLLSWMVKTEAGEILFRGQCEMATQADNCRVEAEIFVPGLRQGSFALSVTLGVFQRSWRIESVTDIQASKETRLLDAETWPSALTCITNQRDWQITHGINTEILNRWRSGSPTLIVMSSHTCPHRPFWRESTYEPTSTLGHKLMKDELWHLWVGIAPDYVLPANIHQLMQGYGVEVQTDLVRVDTRTYESLPLVVSSAEETVPLVVSTVRLQGGHGIQPLGLPNNPAAHWFLQQVLT